MAFDREEKFNLPLFRKLGELGLLGVTVPEEYGGAAFDATAACIVHEELAAAGMWMEKIKSLEGAAAMCT